MEISSFSRWILGIDEGRCTTDIVEATYGNLSENYRNPAYFSKRAILAPFHEIVSSVNDYMQNKFPGEQACYYSSNSIQTDDIEATDLEAEFPPEFLNSLKLGNFPDHELKLKVGVPVILLRNIDQATGLYNGTRMIVKSLGTWSIEVEVLTGSHKGLNFTLLRRQFPIALSFAMTINKSQSQTLTQVGLCLTRQVFTHGQLYVALSRVSSKNGLKIISSDGNGRRTPLMKNIVFKEILN
ncbi:ATP-dependent DNA helicase PIF1 [Linum perenne]